MFQRALASEPESRAGWEAGQGAGTGSRQPWSKESHSPLRKHSISWLVGQALRWDISPRKPLCC